MQLQFHISVNSQQQYIHIKLKKSNVKRTLHKICKNTGIYGSNKTCILAYFTQWHLLNPYHSIAIFLYFLGKKKNSEERNQWH